METFRRHLTSQTFTSLGGMRGYAAYPMRAKRFMIKNVVRHRWKAGGRSMNKNCGRASGQLVREETTGSQTSSTVRTTKTKTVTAMCAEP